MHSTELLKGTLQTIVLKLLNDHGKMYGYEMTQKVKQLSLDKIQITDGALYPTLHRMESDGLLTTELVNIGKRVRKYYSITPAGKNQVIAKIEDFFAFVQTMSRVLQHPVQYGIE